MLRESGVTESAKSGPSGAPRAFAALRRPPVMVRPARLGIGSTLLRIASLSWAVVRLGEWARTSAATPDTCGVAMDVPLKYEYEEPGTVERTLTPGAPRWTVVGP